MGISKLDTLEGRPDFIKRYIKSHGKTDGDILAADATETAASSRVAHQGWTIPAGGNGNPNAMRETVIAMNIGSDIGADDDAGLGVSGAGGGGGGGGATYTTLYHTNVADRGDGQTDTTPAGWSLNSNWLRIRLYGDYAPGPGPHNMDNIGWLSKWKPYGQADDGTGNYQTNHSDAAINMMKIYSGTNAGTGSDDDGYNLDGSCNFFFYAKISNSMGAYIVDLHFPDYMSAASGHGAPWADPGHPGYPLVSNYSAPPPQTAAGDQPVKFFNLAQYYLDMSWLQSSARLKFEVAQGNPNSMPQPDGYTT